LQLTRSYQRVFKEDLLERYEFAEVRNAAATLAGTSPKEFNDIASVLKGFWLTLDTFTDPGKNKSQIAEDLDEAFHKQGWHEASHASQTHFTLKFTPYPKGDKGPASIEFDFETGGHKVDNFRGGVALDVEWNAKDGNLDRDLANFRALHDVGVIDVGVLITRHQQRTKWAANYLAEHGNKIRYKDGKRIILFGTTTTTNIEKLIPRLERGDSGGCPVLAIAVTDKCYKPDGDQPHLPAFGGAAAQAIPDPEQDKDVVAAELEEEG
jgi:hypothetical protein